jgi:hypothetical protein
MLEFTAILSTLVETHAPMVRAAIFCDDEGERVGSFAIDGVDAFELDLLGAAYAPVAARMEPGTCMRVAHLERVVWVATVEGGCYMVVECVPGVDGVLRTELPRAVAALAAHM